MKRHSSWQTASFGEGDRIVRRVQFIVILVLIAALAVSVVMLIPHLGVRGNMQRNYVSIMLQESNNTITRASQLSRTGGTGSIAPLSEIRSSVAVIKAVNTLYRENGGQTPLSDDFLDGIIAQVDGFIEQMKTNVNSTGARQTQLQEDLTGLRDVIALMVEE